MDELAKQDHTYRLSTEEFKRYQGQWYLTLNKSGKNERMRLRPDFRAAVSLKKTVFIVNQVRKLQNPFLQRNIGDGILPQATLGVTRLTVVGGAPSNKCFKRPLFCCSWFRLQTMAIHCNRRVVYTDTPHTSFFSCTVHVFNDVQSHIMAHDEPRLKSPHARVTPYSCHPW